MKINKGLIVGLVLVLVGCFLGTALAKVTPGGPTTHCITTTINCIAANGNSNIVGSCTNTPTEDILTVQIVCAIPANSQVCVPRPGGGIGLFCVRQTGVEQERVIGFDFTGDCGAIPNNMNIAIRQCT